MKAENFNLVDYCTRVGLQSLPEANAAGVAQLMRHQLFSVPFENLDVQAGKIVSLVPEDIVQKIIPQSRGGYCYEVNSLFAMALTALDIEYYFVAARPMFYPGRRPKTHMVVIAKIDGREYLCDCGFGSYGIRAPLALDELNQRIQQDDDFFRLASDDGKNFIVQAQLNGEWVNQYGFDLYPHELLDFVPANFFNSKHPDAVFVQKLLIVQHHPQGRKILLGNSFKRVEGGETLVREIEPGAISALLRDEFNLAWPLE